jgi:hypothetical protein
MCANKYENRQNDEYECCTPSTPPICMKTKEFMFFVLYKFLIESFHLSTEKF